MTEPDQPRPTPMVSAQGVHKSFGALEVLKGITLEVAPGEVMCLVGPSGSGKSTFLRCINHLETVNAGRLYVDGVLVGYHERNGKLHEMHPRDAARQRRAIGMVFQRFNLFPHMTALENIAEAPVIVQGRRKAEAADQARDLLARVGLADKAQAYPAQLSGGQQQRVAIARALVGDRRLVLADEPTGALDTQTGEAVLRVLRARVDAGAAGILVTHEARHAAWADRVVFLRDGAIVDTSGPLAQPEDLLAATGPRGSGPRGSGPMTAGPTGAGPVA